MPARGLLPADRLPRAPAVRPAPVAPPLPDELISQVAFWSADELPASRLFEIGTAAPWLWHAYHAFVYTNILLCLDAQPNGFRDLIQFLEARRRLAKNVRRLAVNGAWGARVEGPEGEAGPGEITLAHKHDISPDMARQLLAVLKGIVELEITNAAWQNDGPGPLIVPAGATFSSLLLLELRHVEFPASEPVLALVLQSLPTIKCVKLEMVPTAAIDHDGACAVVNHPLRVPKAHLSLTHPAHLDLYTPFMRATGPTMRTLYLSFHPDYAYDLQFAGGRAPLSLTLHRQLKTFHVYVPLQLLRYAEDVDRLWERILDTIRSCPKALRQLHFTLFCVKPLRKEISTLVKRTPLRAIARAATKDNVPSRLITFTVVEPFKAGEDSTWARVFELDQTWKDHATVTGSKVECWTVSEDGKHPRWPDGSPA